MLKRLTVIASLAVALSLSGCYPDGPDYVEDYDLVITLHNESYDYKPKNTYAIPDSIVEITGEKIDNPLAPLNFISAATSNKILTRIRQNMNDYGWTEVNKINNPDVILLPSAIETTNLVYYYDWYYYGWYYPGYYPGGGWYYPGYYPPTVTSYTTGSLFLQMVATDSSEATVDGKKPVIWFGIINGLLEGTAGTIDGRINKTVDQMFTQSEYLQQ